MPRVLYAQAVYAQEEIDAVNESLKNSFLSVGPNAEKFEKEVATIFGKKHGVFVNSGSSANLLVAQIIPKGEVITPALTFATTLTPLLQCGLKPVFIDSGLETFLPTIEDIEKAITPETTAVMIPDLLGNRMDSKALRELCDQYNLIYVQDSCDTVVRSTAYGHFVTTSFYGSHIITAMGGGGMVMSDDTEMIDRIRTMRDWGRGVDVSENVDDRYQYEIDGISYDGKFVYTERGFNMRPIDAMAAFGLEQLKRFDRFTLLRNQNFLELLTFFRKYDCFNFPSSQNNANWLALPLTLKDAPFTRFDLINAFEKAGIQTRPIFSGNVTRHKAFREFKKDFPNADYVMEHGILLGIHQGLDQTQRDYIKDTFKIFYAHYTNR